MDKTGGCGVSVVGGCGVGTMAGCSKGLGAGGACVNPEDAPVRKPGTSGSWPERVPAASGKCKGEGEASGIYGVGSACIQPRVN